MADERETQRSASPLPVLAYRGTKPVELEYETPKPLDPDRARRFSHAMADGVAAFFFCIPVAAAFASLASALESMWVLRVGLGLMLLGVVWEGMRSYRRTQIARAYVIGFCLIPAMLGVAVGLLVLVCALSF